MSFEKWNIKKTPKQMKEAHLQFEIKKHCQIVS